MGRLTTEIEKKVRAYYSEKHGYLLGICEYTEATQYAQSAEAYCDKCSRCLSNIIPISLGEIVPMLSGQGLFAVGLLGDSHPSDCPLITNRSQLP
jgi:hypothetical protein